MGLQGGVTRWPLVGNWKGRCYRGSGLKTVFIIFSTLTCKN